MNEYHKIVTVWERDPETKFKTLIQGKWATPEFEYLHGLDWLWTEKVDGTNIRVIWDGEKVVFGGKTDAAQLYAPLVERLQSLFYAGALARIFDQPACLYGEGFGPRIQKGGSHYGESVDFALFDVLVNGNWLERVNVQDIANKLQCQIAPLVGRGSLDEAIAVARSGMTSLWGNFQSEGLVCRPAVEMRDRRGNRIITKIKTADFR